MNAGDTEPTHVLFEGFEPGWIAVDREDKTAICHAFGHGCGFAARRAAQVEDGLAGLGIEQGDDPCRARALHAEQAIAIRASLKEMPRMGYGEEMRPCKLRVDPLGDEVFAQRIGRYAQGIGADGEGGLGVIAFAQGARFS